MRPFLLSISLEGATPIYAQIVEQIKGMVASARLHPGEPLPTLRDLARQLGLNPSTVAKAYAALEREGIIVTRRGGGSFVAGRPAESSLTSLREEHLSAVVGRSVLEALSLGFEPHQVEAAFALHLARWREHRGPMRRESGEDARVQSKQDIVFVGSHDLSIDLLASHVRRAHPELEFSILYSGSLGGLMALERREAHVAGAHLVDEETGEYNLPYVRHLLPAQSVVLITLVHRLQGLMVATGNPKGIRGLEDLGRSEVTFVNRQPGSGTRVLLDRSLKALGIDSSAVKGYQREEYTHLGVAAAVADGSADVGLGIYAAARSLKLDFVPLLKERYDLVALAQVYQDGRLQPLMEVINRQEFHSVVEAMGGYDVSETGKVTVVS